MGCLGIVVSMLMSVVALSGLRLFVGPGLSGWWRDNFGDPVFRVLGEVAVRTNGNTAATLVASVIPFCAVLWIVRMVQAIVTRNSIESMQASQSMSQDLDAARDELRRIFSDDPEQIALYQSRVVDPSAPKRRRHPAAGVAVGCLAPLSLTLLLGPVTFLTTLALYDSLLRLTGMFIAARPLAQSAGAMASRLEPLMPLGQIAFGFVLAERSLLLTLSVGTIAVFTWLVTTMPRAALMWPRGVTPGSILSFAVGLTLMYVLTNALVLLLVLIVASFNLAMMVAMRMLRPVQLRAVGMLGRMRRVPPNKATEPAVE